MTRRSTSNRRFMADAPVSANTTVSAIGLSLVVFVLLMLIRGLLSGIPILGVIADVVYFSSLLVLVVSLGYFLYFSVLKR